MKRIVIIGSGNVATHLAKAFAGVGCRIVQVYSRNSAHALRLASEIAAQPIDSLDRLVTDADFYLIAVADAAVPETSKRCLRSAE